MAALCQAFSAISIHALLAESDLLQSRNGHNINRFLSTLSLRRATVTRVASTPTTVISIHALLAESDSECPHTRQRDVISIHALLAESDLKTPCVKLSIDVFLSTLSLRRATARRASRQHPAGISIHALLAESDEGRVKSL